MCGYVRVYVYIYIFIYVCVLTTPEPTKTAFSQVYKEKNKFSSNYLLHVLLSRTQEQNIYIYLSFNRSIYLSIYLSI